MQNIYTQIDHIFSHTALETPGLAQQILDELKAIRAILKELKPQANHTPPRADHGFLDYVNRLRAHIRTQEEQGYLSWIIVDREKLSINERGLLYEIDSMRILSRQEASQIYKILYQSYLENGTLLPQKGF